MRHEEQPRTTIVIPLAVVAVIKSSDDRLSSTSCSHYEVAPTSADLALCLKLV